MESVVLSPSQLTPTLNQLAFSLHPPLQEVCAFMLGLHTSLTENMINKDGCLRATMNQPLQTVQVVRFG